MHEYTSSPQPAGDNRRVVLIKSAMTKNRFYALADPATGIRNADIIEYIPEELLLGIAYPCLEDGLNDFAVIRTTFETLEYFPDDQEMRTELMEIINEARGNLIRRLTELRDRIHIKRAHFLGTDLNEFKQYAVDMIQRGYPRRNLDSMMKLNVFASVAEAEGHTTDTEPLYRFEFRDMSQVPTYLTQPAREFVARLFADVLDSVLDDANYETKYLFDRNVFQKFIALMFVNYATTDPIFYGTNRADYGVSEDKDMESTPLYIAVARELRAIEIELAQEDGVTLPFAPTHEPDFANAPTLGDSVVELPGMLVNEDILLSPISAICAAAHQLCKTGDHRTIDFASIILKEASHLVSELKRLNIVSPFADDPGQSDYGND